MTLLYNAWGQINTLAAHNLVPILFINVILLLACIMWRIADDGRGRR